MQILKHNGVRYLKIKEHYFQILNELRKPDGSDVFFQVTTSTSTGIKKEYLPDGWAMHKKKYKGLMIFTLYLKKHFNYKTQAKNIVNTIFIAPSVAGAKYLYAKWILSEILGVDDSEENVLELVKYVTMKGNNYVKEINNYSGDLKAIIMWSFDREYCPLNYVVNRMIKLRK